MKKKYIIMAAACLLLIAAGVCYSIAYFGLGSKAAVVTTLSEKETKQQTLENSSLSDADKQEAADTLSTNGLTVTDEDSSYQAGLTEDLSNPEDTSGGKASDAENSADIYVHLCGAVKNPSVYRTTSGSRLVELIELAGGLTEDAAGDYINQAMTVEDGQRIYIPTRSEVKELPAVDFITTGNSESPAGESKLININNADAGELMELPGIGQAKADSILAYREASGGFQVIEDLMKVPGIKEGLFSQISSYITVK